jgi:hypothetical protein
VNGQYHRARDQEPIDTLAIELRMDGDLEVPLTRAEWIELIARADAAGWTNGDLARIGILRPDRYRR